METRLQDDGTTYRLKWWSKKKNESKCKREEHENVCK